MSANLRTPRGTDVRAAKLLNVSARSVATALRVLASGDKQLIEAVEAGEIAVSDAAAIVELGKPRQREALALVRSGKARTLRDAAKMKKPRDLPPAVRASNPREPQVMRGKVRRAYRYFMTDYESMQHYLDLAVEGCGARDALTAAQRAMHDCRLHYGRKGGKPDCFDARRNPRHNSSSGLRIGAQPEARSIVGAAAGEPPTEGRIDARSAF